MCYCVYIGTDKKLDTNDFIPNQSTFYFIELNEAERKGIKAKFLKSNVYYVGSSSQCSCGLNFPSQYFNDKDWQDEKESPTKFLEYLKEATKNEDIEYYCCWEGDWESDIEEKLEIDIRTISLENYFELNERQFIKFKKQE